MTRIEGSVAVVTGAGSGIGRALARQLAVRGCRLALSDIHGGRLEQTAAACRERGADVLTATLDVADRDAVEQHAAKVPDRFGAVHLVFNNAGVAFAGGATEQDHDDIRRVLDVNLWGVINGSQAFLPQLIASGRGHLVNVSSLFGILAVPSQSAYNASKFAVRGYTESLASEMAAEGHPVRVSCVHPGGIATRIVKDAALAAGRDRKEMVEQFDRVARTSPQTAARIILRGVERDRTRILVGPDAWALDAVVRVLGGLYPRVVGWVTRRGLGALQSPSAGSSSGTPAAPINAAPDSRSS